MQLHQIREARAAKVSEARSLLASMPTLTPEAQTKFDAIKAEIVNLEGQESRAVFLEDMERKSLGTPVHKSQADMEGRVSVVEVMRAQMEGRSLSGAAAEFAQESERRTGRKAQGVFVPLAALESRAVNTTATAPEIVPTIHRPDMYIEPFRNNLLARRLGVRVLSGLSGNLSIPKHATGGTTGWVAENAALPTGDMSFDSVTMSPKHAGGIQEMSRQLLQQSSPDIEALVRNDLSALLAQAIDSALIKGGGTNEPVGVLSTVGIQTANLATLTWANILTMLQKLDISNTSAANIVASMKVKAKLQGTLKAAGIAGYLMENGRVADLPAFFSNQVPEKTGTPNTGHLSAIEGAINRQLLTPQAARTMYAEFSLEGLLRGASTERAAFYSSAIASGWMLKSEARKLENLPEIDGLDSEPVELSAKPRAVPQPYPSKQQEAAA